MPAVRRIIRWVTILAIVPLGRRRRWLSLLLLLLLGDVTVRRLHACYECDPSRSRCDVALVCEIDARTSAPIRYTCTNATYTNGQAEAVGGDSGDGGTPGAPACH